MKFLVDQQLPPALVSFLISKGHEARHVLELQLDQVKDALVWDYARRNDLALVTKDEDFADMVMLHPQEVAVVWVRMGNCRNEALLQVMERALPEIQKAFRSGDHLIEVY